MHQENYQALDWPTSPKSTWQDPFSCTYYPKKSFLPGQTLLPRTSSCRAVPGPRHVGWRCQWWTEAAHWCHSDGATRYRVILEPEAGVEVVLIKKQTLWYFLTWGTWKVCPFHRLSYSRVWQTVKREPSRTNHSSSSSPAHNAPFKTKQEQSF